MKFRKKVRRRVRAIGRWLQGKGVFYTRDLHRPVEWHGSERCGWAICPEGLTNDSIVYSLGIGQDASFDQSLIDRYGLTVYAFDPTPETAAWLAGQSMPGNFRYQPVAISDYDGSADFFAPVAGSKCSTLQARIPGQTPSHRVTTRRLKTLMRDLGHDRIDVLKMDIEGAEYGVLRDLLNDGVPVRQLLVEFHHRFPTIGAGKTKDAVRMLRAHGFRICWVSPTCNEYLFWNTRN